MIPGFFQKKQLKTKEAILRGIYEENLRIIGKGADAAPRRRAFFFRKNLFLLLLSLLAILTHGAFVRGPSTERYPATDMLSRASSLVTSADSAGPSEYGSLLENGETSIRRVFGLGVKTIMIDPGHGGSDPGTIGRLGTMEKDVVLDIAKRLKRRLEERGGYRVIMTREGDITLPLNKRVELAFINKADLFLSVHLNYLPARPINIIETYYFGPTSDAKALRLAEQENAGSDYGISDFKAIIEKIGETVKLQESRRLASAIQDNLFLNMKQEGGNARDFGVKRAPFVVLIGVDVPSVLAEVSCLSNREEEIKLSTASHRENIANYLESGILDYLRKGETNYAERK